MAEKEENSKVFDLNNLLGGFKSQTVGGKEKEFESRIKEKDEEQEDVLLEDETDEQEAEGEETESEEVDDETSDEDEQEDESSEEEDQESEEDDEEEGEEPESETDEEIEEGDEESEEETDESEEGGEESEEDEPLIEEFDVLEFTDGVFESKDDLKKTSQLLKENPELKKMLEFYEENGTLLPYLQATQVNVDEFSDIDILREKFKIENAELGFTADQMEKLFQEDVLKKYNLDDDDEDDIQVGMLRLKKDAAGVRKEFKAEQQKLLLPQERDALDTIQKAEQEKTEKLEAQKNKLGFQIRKQVKDGKIDIKVDKDNIVKMGVSPKKLSALIDSMDSVEMFTDEKGNFDLRRMAMMTDPDAFIQSISTTYKSEGKKEFVQKELKNRSAKGKKPKATKPVAKKKIDPTDPRSFKGAKISVVRR